MNSFLTASFIGTLGISVELADSLWNQICKNIAVLDKFSLYELWHMFAVVWDWWHRTHIKTLVSMWKHTSYFKITNIASTNRWCVKAYNLSRKSLKYIVFFGSILRIVEVLSILRGQVRDMQFSLVKKDDITRHCRL